jgi:transglutaminase-like putative cysteine protease
MLIKIGFDIAYTAPQPTPMVVMLSIHPSRVADLLAPENIVCDPPTPLHYYHDSFGNWCGRLVLPQGRLLLSNRATVRDSGLPDVVMPHAQQIPVENLPDEVILFLLASRYCETDRMMDLAWSLFKDTPMGWGRVQAICDYVHGHVTFGYQFAAPTKSAHDVHAERRGVCRDFAHLAVTLCRCMNIPARYCTGYLGDIGVPPDESPMDFSAWFEVYLSGHWYTFDARHNAPRIGRILMGRGRDAADVPLSTGFGRTVLSEFKVYTDEVVET